jgi:2-polyprenyl-6-methoxyphenol hydroxylase-like FAD-dependent oxidoreductase
MAEQKPIAILASSKKADLVWSAQILSETKALPQIYARAHDEQAMPSGHPLFVRVVLKVDEPLRSNSTQEWSVNDSSIHDVIVAGAGPVGLLLAAELRLGGASVLVLEQAERADSALKGLPFGMRGLSVPTVEALYRRGLLDALRSLPLRKGTETQGDSAPAAHWMKQTRSPGGHFAGIQFFHDRIDSARWPYRLPNPASAAMVTTMETIETVLAAHALALGVEIRRGLHVDGFDASDDRVAIHAGARTFEAGWLVGCDGGRSTVRKLGGFEFSGTEPEFTGYSVEVEMADAEKLAPGRQYTATGVYTFQPPGTLAMVDFDGGAFHRTQAVTLEHVQSVLRKVSCTDVTVTALKLATTWTDRAFQATQYRKGRVLLAGDASHIHSPLGGQGLNLGLGDAMNLGWKLAATVGGRAPDDLLDTYGSERHPVGVQILDWSRAQVGLMRPSASSRALAAIIRDLADTPDGATYFAERVWGVSLHQDLGAGHPLVGHSAPDFELADGHRLADHLRNGKGVLLELGPDTSRTLASRWSDRINYIAQDAGKRFGLSAVLVRPDGVVGWASEDLPAPDELSATVTRWFGKPLAYST